MYGVLVQFEIKAGLEQRFHEAVTLQAHNSVQLEEHCHVFDVCQSNDDNAKFVLYELYTSADAFSDHLKSAHFLQFDHLVGSWVKSKTVQLLTRTVAGGETPAAG